MISIIISTYRQDYLKNLKENIAKSIGVPYELIAVENKHPAKGLSEVYNSAAQKAKHDILCFVHEDIEILTMGWGAPLINLFKNDSNIGVVGIAGSKVKLSFPTGWTCFNEKFDTFHFTHRKGTVEELSSNNPDNSITSKVVVLDGVFLATKKSVWQKVGFSPQLNGFHFYDIDYSIRVVLEGYAAVVWFGINLIHFSSGKFDNLWVKTSIDYHKKNKLLLSQLNNFQKKDVNVGTVKTIWLRRLLIEPINWVTRIRLATSYGWHANRHYLRAAFQFVFRF